MNKKTGIVRAYPSAKSIAIYTYNSSLSSGIWRSQEINSMSNLVMKRPVLDIGCGNGRFARIVFQDKMDYGLDIDKKVVESAKKSSSYKKYILADAHKIPLPSNSINTVFSNSVFEHIPNLEGVIAEISRVLKKDGQLIFTTHAPLSKNFFILKFLSKYKLNFLAKLYLYILVKQLQLRTLWELKTWSKNLKKVGLEIEEAKNIISPKTAFWYEVFLPFTFVQNRLTFIKKLHINKFLFPLLKLDYDMTGKVGRNFYIRAVKK